MTGQQPLDLKPYVDVIHRHRVPALSVLLLGLAATLTLLLILPDAYRSSELLAVQQPEIAPGQLKTPQASSGENGQAEPVMEGLEKLSQETYTDARLTELITEMGLYGPLVPGRSAASLVGVMRKHIELTVPERSFTYENFKRQKEERGANLLEISFEYSEPEIARRVTSRLSDLFMATSLAERTKSAVRTREFLEQSVAQTEQKLVAKEKEIEQVERRFAGSLPDQLAENLSDLGRLEEELRGVNDRIAAQEVVQQTNAESSPEAKLQTLRLQLDSLRAQYSERHPDVIELEREIAETKLRLANQASEDHADLETGKRPRGNGSGTYAERASRLPALAENLRAQIATLRARIAETPAHQQQLAGLTREYEVLEAQYHDLRDKELGAQLNEELVRQREGLRLQIIEPASLPKLPAGPNRLSIALFGALLSLSLAAALPFVLYFTDTSFKEPDELRELYGLPVVGVIPRLAGAQSVSGAAASLALVLTSLVVFAVAGAAWACANLLH